MTAVRILTSIASADWSFHPGQIAELPDEQAAIWIASGLAEAIASPVAAKSTARPTRKK